MTHVHVMTHAAKLRSDPSRTVGSHWFDEYGVLALLVFCTFWFRFSVADVNSYWLDELYSVERYTLPFETVSRALSSLAESSIHPPLYQLVLYYWIEFFGDAEIATRTLSNLYIAIATISIHRVGRLVGGQRVADAAAIAFALSYGAMYYGLETRSYAQTLMLSIISTHGFLLWIRHHRAPATWRAILRSFPLVIFNVASLGLLLTHYFNFFFWSAQAVTSVLVALVWADRGARARLVITLTGSYAAQFGLFVAVWGRITVQSYERMEGRYSTTSPEASPLAMVRAIADESFSLPTGLIDYTMLLAVALSAGYVVFHYRRLPATESSLWNVSSLIYITGMIYIPAVVAYLAFVLVKAERFSTRYVLYLLPPVILVFTLAGRSLLQVLTRHFRTRSEGTVRRLVAPGNLYLPVALVMTGLLVIPGTVRAASESKADWRGISERVVATVQGDADRRYLIYETSFRSTPMLDYYLRRFGNDVTVDGTIRRVEERRGDGFAFENDPALESADRVVVVFAHHPISSFPLALSVLDKMLVLELSQLDAAGRGFLVYSVPGV